MTLPILTKQKSILIEQLASTVIQDLQPWQRLTATVNFSVDKVKFILAKDRPADFNPFELEANEKNWLIFSIGARKITTKGNDFPLQKFYQTIAEVQKTAHRVIMDNYIESEIDSAGVLELSVLLEKREVALFQYQWDTSAGNV